MKRLFTMKDMKGTDDWFTGLSNFVSFMLFMV